MRSGENARKSPGPALRPRLPTAGTGALRSCPDRSCLSSTTSIPSDELAHGLPAEITRDRSGPPSFSGVGTQIRTPVDVFQRVVDDDAESRPSRVAAASGRVDVGQIGLSRPIASTLESSKSIPIVWKPASEKVTATGRLRIRAPRLRRSRCGLDAPDEALQPLGLWTSGHPAAPPRLSSRVKGSRSTRASVPDPGPPGAPRSSSPRFLAYDERCDSSDRRNSRARCAGPRRSHSRDTSPPSPQGLRPTFDGLVWADCDGYR